MCGLALAVTGPPPRNSDLKTCVTGGSRSPHGYLPVFTDAIVVTRNATTDLSCDCHLYQLMDQAANQSDRRWQPIRYGSQFELP